MDEIKIYQKNNFFYVKQGNKLAKKLNYTEMISLVSELTIPDKKPFLQRMEEIPEEKSYEPKDGDFVYDSNPLCEYVYIFKSKKSDDFNNYYVRYIKSIINIKYNNYCDVVSPHLATEKEKQTLLDALHKEGKDWDAEKKEIVPYKWKPTNGEIYWYVSATGEVIFTVWNESEYDQTLYKIGNCFPTEEEAQLMIKVFKEVFKNK